MPGLQSILLLSLACVATFCCGCDLGFHRGVRVFLEEPFPKKLSKWHLFAGSAKKGQLTPNTGVLPYDLNTPLFSDYADKYRFVWMPAGTAAEYRDDVTFEFPVGTILAKSFAFPLDDRPGERSRVCPCLGQQLGQSCRGAGGDAQVGRLHGAGVELAVSRNRLVEHDRQPDYARSRGE